MKRTISSKISLILVMILLIQLMPYGMIVNAETVTEFTMQVYDDTNKYVDENNVIVEDLKPLDTYYYKGNDSGLVTFIHRSTETNYSGVEKLAPGRFWGNKNYVLKFRNAKGTEIIFEPDSELVEGKFTTPTYNCFSPNGGNFYVTVYYNGTSEEVFIPPEYGSYSNGTVTPFRIGTYYNLEKISLVNNTTGDTVFNIMDFYVTTDGVAPTAAPGPTATPTPTPKVTSVPTDTPCPTEVPTPSLVPTATPVPTPTPDPDDVVSLGLGASFLLYPGERSGPDLTESEGLYKGSWSAIVDKDGNYPTTAYTIYNSAPYLNQNNGISEIYIPAGARINKAGTDPCYGHPSVSMQGEGARVTYTPKFGLLLGVETNLTIPYQFGAKGTLYAEIKHDGKTETITVTDSTYTTPTNFKILDLGTYSNVESVSLISGGGDKYMPPVCFKVVNENIGKPAPDISFRKYVRPNIETVAPAQIEARPTVTGQSDVSINEVCSSNVSIITDKNGEYSDYIELYNKGEVDLDISGYGLTDNENKLFKWVIPSGTIIPAGGYLVIFASGNDEVIDGEIHASYSISRGGETIMLTDTAGDVISIIDLLPLQDDEAMGRYPDGSDVLKVMSPTFNTSNSTADSVAATYVAPPEFSHESGMYDSEFELTLSAQNGTIYYTTDGSKPTTSSKIYSSSIDIYDNSKEDNVLAAMDNKYVPSIKVDKAMVIRAMTADSEGNTSSVVSKTFFVGYDMAEDFNNAMVLSVTTDASNLYDETTGIFKNANANNEGREWEREVHLNMFESDGSLVIDQDCGIRVRGLGSVNQTQKAFNFYARSDYGAKYFDYPVFADSVSKLDGSLVESYRSFCIRTGSQRDSNVRFTDGAMQGLSKSLDTAWQSYRDCVVFINGEYWGQYYLQERVSVDYIDEHYGIPEENCMLIKNGESKGDYGTQADLNYYRNEWNWLANTDFSINDNYELLCEKFDIQNLIAYYVSNLNMLNRDWVGSGYNYTAWRSRTIEPSNPYADGKWRFLMYDCDMCYDSQADNGISMSINTNPGKALMSNPSLKRLFTNALCDTYSYQYEPQRVYNEYLYGIEELRFHAEKMKSRWNTLSPSNLDSSVGSYYNRIIERPYYHEQEYRKNLGLTGVYTHMNVRVNDGTMGRVKVNFIDPDFTNNSYTGRYFTDYTQDLTAIPYEGYKFVGWTCTEGTSLSSTTEKTTIVTLSENGSRVTAIFAPDTELEGTIYNPFRISTAVDLQEMAANINSGVNCNSYYVLENDIDLSGVHFEAIGTEDFKFNGNFDGNGHVIKNLVVENSVKGQGVFGYTGENAVVKKLGVENVSITGGKNVGAVVGNNMGYVVNCYSTGTLSGESTVGGIVGNNVSGVVENCFSIATINSDSTSTLSGITGKTEAEGSVINCYSLITPVAKLEGTIDSATRIATTSEFSNSTITTLLNGSGSVWVQGSAYPQFSGSDANALYLTIGSGFVNVISTKPVSGTLIIAEYNGTILNTVVLRLVTKADAFPIPSTMTGTIKAYLVSDLDNIMPLCANVSE